MPFLNLHPDENISNLLNKNFKHVYCHGPIPKTDNKVLCNSSLFNSDNLTNSYLNNI